MSIRALWVSDYAIVPIMRHAHDFYQLIYCRHGVGEICIDDCTYTATRGKAYLVKPGRMHSITPREDFRVMELKFSVEGAGQDASISLLPTEMDIDARASLRLSLRDILREGTSGALYSHEATSAAATLFFVKLLREYRISAEDTDVQICHLDTPQKPPAGKNGDEDFLRVLDYIERHLSEEIILDDLCELVGLERSYLITRFKKSFGLSPMRYVGTMRIEQAKHLLSTTEKSITEIAYETGFGSIHYFSRTFKRTVGVAPNEYRERNVRG